MILIYGATGFTGTLVAQALIERGAPTAIAGRDNRRLAELAAELGGEVEIRSAHVHEPATLLDALDGCRVVVNCAGPFSRLGEPVVRAAIDRGVHYIDTSGEQAFLRAIYERYESLARRRGISVVNGCAFEVAIGDWAGAIAARHGMTGADIDDPEPLDELIVAYAIAGLRTTRGTQLSAIESLSQPGSVWRIDRWEPITPGAQTRIIEFSYPFGRRETLSIPSGEVITLPRHSPARFVQTYLSLSGDTGVSRAINRLANLISPALPVLVASPLGALAKARVGIAGSEPNRREREANQWSVVAEAARGRQRARVEVSGFDLYGISAEIAANAALVLYETGRARSGVLAPSELIVPEAGLGALDVDTRVTPAV